MGEDRLTFSVGGQLAEGIREAARAAGASPDSWVGGVIARQLASAPASPPAAEQPPPADVLGEADGWEQVSDQSGTFSASLPRGWQNRAWVVPTPTMKYPMVTSTSPDGVTTLFSGDADIPMFLDPSAGGFGGQPGVVVRPPTPAQQFLAEWAHFRHGAEQGFRVVAVAEDQQVVELAGQGLARSGLQPGWLTGARLEAEFNRDGSRVKAVFLATTMGVGLGWLAQVHGVTSSEDPAAFLPALLRLIASVESSPAEKQRMQAERMASQAQHQATMQSIQQNTAMMTAGHQQRMAGIQASGIAHQQNMAARQQSFDAGLQSWQEQQSGRDAQHAGYMDGLRAGGAVPGVGGDPQQDFLNTIREERTVLDGQGQAHQVEAGADRYYHNEYTNTWVGLQEHQDIVEVTGGDRDDYREGTVQS